MLPAGDRDAQRRGLHHPRPAETSTRSSGQGISKKGSAGTHSCRFLALYVLGASNHSGKQGLGFLLRLGQGSAGWQSPAFKAHSWQERSGLNSAPQGSALPGCGQDRATQPLCTSASASPNPGTTRKGEAGAVLFQSRTKASFYSFWRCNIQICHECVCAQTGHLCAFSQDTSIQGELKARGCFITWLSLTSGKETLLPSQTA